MTAKQLLEQALSKIKSARDCHPNAVQELIFEAEELLEQALSAPVQEPRWYCIDKTGMATLCADEDDARQSAKLAEQDWPRNAPYRAVQLCEYTTPPAAQRQWVGLMEDEILECRSVSHLLFYRAIEAKLKEKNT